MNNMVNSKISSEQISQRTYTVTLQDGFTEHVMQRIIRQTRQRPLYTMLLGIAFACSIGTLIFCISELNIDLSTYQTSTVLQLMRNLDFSSFWSLFFSSIPYTAVTLLLLNLVVILFLSRKAFNIFIGNV